MLVPRVDVFAGYEAAGEASDVGEDDGGY